MQISRAAPDTMSAALIIAQDQGADSSTRDYISRTRLGTLFPHPDHVVGFGATDCMVCGNFSCRFWFRTGRQDCIDAVEALSSVVLDIEVRDTAR